MICGLPPYSTTNNSTEVLESLRRKVYFLYIIEKYKELWYYMYITLRCGGTL